MAPLTAVWRRLPTATSLLIGILVGLLFANIFSSRQAPAAESWSGARSNSRPNPGSGRAPARNQPSLPTLDQRHRVLELLSTLSPHHTTQCTRHAQPIYVAQALKRYEPLFVKKKSWNRVGGWLSGWGAKPVKPTGGEYGLSSNRQYDKDDDESGRSYVKRDLSGQKHKYFFAINLYNSFDVIPDIFATLFRVAAILGYHNVYVSIYENGSTDQTKALLKIFDALAGTAGLRVEIRSSMRTRGKFNHRIEYLAEVRNAALVPLHELRENNDEKFDSIVFMNDILPCVDDLLELIWQSRRQNAGITCASDYMFHEDIGAPVFYDNWVARDINGTALENEPFESVFHHTDSAYRFQNHLPLQVQSCWNGIAIMDPAPLYMMPPVKFRMANLDSNECSASECSLICNDYTNAGYGRILMVPRVKLAYDNKVYPIIHPDRRNLTAIRGYKRLGGLPDDPHTDPQDRTWYGPHDRLFTQEETDLIQFEKNPEYVWCWGWDGAGDLDGPDVDPIWEKMEDYSFTEKAVTIKHDRSFKM
ncbi:Mannosyltransferase 1, CMT1 [Phaffia rhodozyma]|uniref:Mannosyltransferase 1, CMT1 n=1 Tax=Phaffia rhodozyma TaxID=264483 RepID=A0A0F7SF22_PHARH|nr:Mannosyltransferase 1, CMT1 [Phaffia rhodozyma]